MKMMIVNVAIKRIIREVNSFTYYSHSRYGCLQKSLQPYGSNTL